MAKLLSISCITDGFSEVLVTSLLDVHRSRYDDVHSPMTLVMVQWGGNTVYITLTQCGRSSCRRPEATPPFSGSNFYFIFFSSFFVCQSCENSSSNPAHSFRMKPIFVEGPYVVVSHAFKLLYVWRGSSEAIQHLRIKLSPVYSLIQFFFLFHLYFSSSPISSAFVPVVRVMIMSSQKTPAEL